MACHHQDLLQLQFWILAVAVIGAFLAYISIIYIFIVCVSGFLEMALSFADMDVWDKDDDCHRNRGLFVVAKLVWAFKNTLARILVLIVSMGFGVVKYVIVHLAKDFEFKIIIFRPRLSEGVKKQIAAVACISFLLFAAYGLIHGDEVMIMCCESYLSFMQCCQGNAQTTEEKSQSEMLIIIPVSVLDAVPCLKQRQ